MNKSQCPQCKCVTKAINYLYDGFAYLFNYTTECCRKGKTQPRASHALITDTAAVVDLTPSILRKRHIENSPEDRPEIKFSYSIQEDLSGTLVADTTTMIEAPEVSVKDRLETMKLLLDLILSNKTTSSEQAQGILNGFIDQFIDENQEICHFALNAIKEVILRETIKDSEIANAVVYRFIILLRAIGFVEHKSIWDYNPKLNAQLAILESLAELIKLVKIKSSKKLNDLVMCLIETSKHTINSGRRHILDALDNLHRTDNNAFDTETLNIEIELLLNMRNKPCCISTTSRTHYILQSIHDNKVYGHIISDAQLQQWEPKGWIV